jgi:hypothetical protein
MIFRTMELREIPEIDWVETGSSLENPGFEKRREFTHQKHGGICCNDNVGSLVVCDLQLFHLF